MLMKFQKRLFTNTVKLKKAIYAGTFDPPSSGHLDIIQRGLTLCDKLYVGIGTNISKKPIFPIEERERLLGKITKNLGDVEIVKFEGLLSEYVKENDIDFMIRGIRSYQDFDSEFSMGILNRKLCGKETIFLMASTGRVHISSTIIRELSMYQQKLENFVPQEIEEEVYNYLFEYYKKNGLSRGKK